MPTALYAGLRTGDIGTFSVVVGGAAGSGTATLTAGTYCHQDLSSVTGASTYTSLATATKTALDALAIGTWTVTFSTSTWFYTISHGSAEFTLTWTGAAGTNLARALGFDPALVAASSARAVTGTIRPYYLRVPQIAARSKVKRHREPQGTTREAVSDGGTAYGASRDTTERIADWVHSMETLAATFTDSATASVPWTWEHFFTHVRMDHPFYLLDGSTSEAHWLRAEGADFSDSTVARVVEDYDGLWNLSIKSRRLGTI